MSEVLDPWTLLRIAVAAGFFATALYTAGLALYRVTFPAAAATQRDMLNRHMPAAALAAAVLVLLQWPLQAVYLGGDRLSAAFDPMLLRMVFDGATGEKVVTALVGLALIQGMLLDGPRARVWGMALGLLGVVLVIAAFTQVGHTRDEPRWLLGGLLGIHLATAAFWLASLLPLYRLAGSADISMASRILSRFGRIGAGFVPVLLVAGITLAWLLAGGLVPLFTTGYGQLLLGKIALVALLLGFAAANKWRLVPAFAAGHAGSARALRRSIVAEAVLASTILALTAVLTTVTSPAS